MNAQYDFHSVDLVYSCFLQ